MTLLREIIHGINELVRQPGNWKEKRQALLDEASDEERTSIEEFCSWFDPEVGR